MHWPGTQGTEGQLEAGYASSHDNFGKALTGHMSLHAQELSAFANDEYLDVGR